MDTAGDGRYIQIDVMAEVESEVFIDPELNQRLHEAVVEGDDTEVQGLLQKFSRDEARDILHRCSSDNEVPLIIVAIRHRHVHLVQLFVDHYDVTVDRTDNIEPPEDAESAMKAEWSPILESILVSCPKILDIISKKVRDINSEYPAHLACQRQTPEAIKILVILIRNGADINLRDKGGLTPLITACQYGNTGMAHVLLRYGASGNLCSSDGKTALHCLIKRIDDVKKSKQNRFRRLSKVLLQDDMEQKLNAQGLTPLRLACLKGNTYMVEILLDNISVNDRERANCYELLASSLFHIKKASYKYLCKAMKVRNSHDPPLWKCRKPDGLEAILSRVEAQTSEELQVTNKENFDEISDELLLARQRILDEALYNDYLLPFIGQYICHKTKERCVRLAMSCPSRQLGLLLYAFKIQQQSPVPPNPDILKDMIKWIDKVCRHVEMDCTVDMSVLIGILDSIEEFYKCKNTENAWLAIDTYVLLLNFLYRIVCTRNDECIDRQAMTERFLRLTKGTLEANLNPSTSESNTFRSSIGGWHFLSKLVPGDNILHTACREVRPILRNATLDNGLADLLKLLHACGEDVNMQNSDGQTPLHDLLCDSVPVRESITMRMYRGQHLRTCLDFAPAVHSLLLKGANSNLRNKSKATSLHAAMIGYVCYVASFWSFHCDHRGWSSIVELLMKSGANPNAIDSRGFTPLHVLMDRVFHEGMGYDEYIVRHTGAETD